MLVDVVHVADGRRKGGVGTLLLRESVVFADEVGAGDVLVNVPPTARDVNRFYARLGFAPQVIRRSAPVGHLRRKLGVEARLDPRDVDGRPDARAALAAAPCPADAAAQRRASLTRVRRSGGRAAGR